MQNPFSLKFLEISQEVQQKSAYLLGIASDVIYEFPDILKISYSFNHIYEYSFPPLPKNGKAEVANANSEFILEIFKENFNMDNYNHICKDHLNRLKELIVCPDEISNKIFEKITDILYKEKVDISSVISNMCDNIINDILNANLEINEDVKGLFVKTSFSDGIIKFRGALMKQINKINLTIIYDIFKKYLYNFISNNEDDSKRKVVSRIISNF